jgi:hypothetical protein
MTTTPNEPVTDPEVVPSGDPSINPATDPNPVGPGEDPGVPDGPETQPSPL